jgi:uncharacterized damage-inducible protein DinB
VRERPKNPTCGAARRQRYRSRRTNVPGRRALTSTRSDTCWSYESTEQAKRISLFLIAALEQESATTRKIIAAVPAEKSDYRPHPTNKSELELANHIATSEVWFLNGIAAANVPTEEGPSFSTPTDALAWYDREFPAALAKVKALSGEQLVAVADLFGMKFPNVVYLNFCQVHSIHHRGQLSAYLRPMGAKVPSIYGGSADEPFQMTETVGA